MDDSRLNQGKCLQNKGDLKALTPQVIHKCQISLFISLLWGCKTG